jgi:hypothetical protein
MDIDLMAEMAKLDPDLVHALKHPMVDDPVFQRHIARLLSSMSAHSRETICEFITQNTFLRGENFSFADHEYQEFILRDQSKEKVIIKSAQMGISEMSARLALAMSNLIPGFSTIYTLPSASAAVNFMKTRIDPIIVGSAYLSESVSRSVNNTEMKQFGDSYLYLKGAQVDTQAISVPADMLIGDEVDNSNQEVLTLFESRLIHSKYQYNVKLSTPSIPGYGIDAAYKESRRHVHLCKCSHCNTWFEPDYFDHIRIPDFKGDLKKDIVKSSFANPNFRWQESFVGCPKCGLPADLSEQHRDWVCENPDDNYVAAGFKVSPFSCPNIILPSHLVRDSVKYERIQDFYNQRLGMALEDKEATLGEEELLKCFITDEVSLTYPMVMGLDMGNLCACTISAVLPDDRMIVVHKEMIPLFKVVKRRAELSKMYRVRSCVVDHGPYTETVYVMQQSDSKVFAGIYTRNRKSAEVYKVKDQEEDKEEGKEDLRVVHISRDKGFDLLMGRIRESKLLVRATQGVVKEQLSDEDATWVRHLQDMKRVREFDKDELIFVWRKTSGEDHYHHSLLYALIASKLLGMTNSAPTLKTLITKFKVKHTNL